MSKDELVEACDKALKGGRLDAAGEILWDECEALRAQLTQARGIGARWHSLCVECGPNVGVDEDGCCASCGATATGAWLNSFRALASHPSSPEGEKP